MSTLSNDQLQHIAGLIAKAYKHEIVKEGDWWYGIDEYDFNIHDFGREGSGHFSINVYEHNGLGMDKYNHWIDLQPIYLGN